jgi:hypothetical protein
MVRMESMSRREQEGVYIGWNGFTIEYFKWFFKSEGVKMLFKAQIMKIYNSDWSPDTLCRLFKSKCCVEDKHTPYCTKVWTQFLEFLRDGMIEELEEMPASPVKKRKTSDSTEIEETTTRDEAEECLYDGDFLA